VKVLHILNHSVPHTDGYCIRSANIVRFQKELGWYPVVVTSPRHEPIPSGEVEVIDGVRYYRTPKGVIGVRAIREILAIRRLKATITRAVEAERPDVVHSHSPCTWTFAAGAVARRYSIPFVYEVRGIWEDSAVDQGRLADERSWRYRLRRWLETTAMRRASRVATISEGLATEIEARGVRRPVVVPNGVDSLRFCDDGTVQSGGRSTVVARAPRIGYIGSLYAWEGVEDLVRAAGILRERVPGIQIHIIGGGERHDAIEKMIDELSLKDTVRLIGAIAHEKIKTAYDELDVLVYPRRASRVTQLVTPLKPLEAMALGKAIVISDVGGLRELCHVDTAAVFSAGDSVDLAAKCIALLDRDDERYAMGVRAREHVRRNRDWRVVIQRYRDLYEGVVGAREWDAALPVRSTVRIG